MLRVAFFHLALPLTVVALVRNQSCCNRSNSSSISQENQSVQNASDAQIVDLNLTADWQPSAALESFVQSGHGCIENAAYFGKKTGNSACLRHVGGGPTSFDNKYASGCSTKAILTIPHSFYETIDDLRRSGRGNAIAVLAGMLSKGFRTYRSKGHKGAVMQCIHKPCCISVHWLHLHSFCPGSRMDGMPGGGAYCAVMKSQGDALRIARRWAAER